MRNHYFYLDCFFGMDEPSLDSAYSDALETLLAGQDFVPGNPLAIEYYHVTSFDNKAGKYIKRPGSIIFFNIPQIDEDGKIIATAEWPYKTADEFSEYLKQTSYCHFIDEHWSQGDFDSQFTSSNGFQVVRFLFVNHISSTDNGHVQIKSETVL